MVEAMRQAAGRARRVWWALGLVVLGAGVSSALAMYTYSRRKPSPDEVWQQAWRAFQARRIDEADAKLKALAALRSPTPHDWLLRAQVDMAKDRTEQALTDLHHVPDSDPMAAQARLQEGQIELRRRRARAAEEALLHALKLDPKLVQAHRELIYIYGMQLRRRLLSDQFEALSRLTPLTFKMAFDWCLTRGVVWDPSEVSDVLKEFIGADPSDRASRLALAESLRQLGRLDEADETLAVLPPADADARSARARIALDRGDEPAAEALLAEGPADHPGLAFLRGRMAVTRHDAAAAEPQFRIAYAADPENRDVLFFLGNALRMLGRDDEAQPFLDAARKWDALGTLIQRAASEAERTDPKLPYQIGQACEALHHYPEAITWYNLAIARDPLDQKAQTALFRVRELDRSAAAKH